MPKKKRTKLNLIILASFVLGIILATQLSTNRPLALISLRSLKDIEKQIAIEEEHIINIDKMIAEVDGKIKNHKPLTSQEAKENFEKIVADKKALAGYGAVEGYGIELKVEDSKRELKKDENPNNLVVHDQDILMLVNDLKVAGAEAMAINGERLTANTEIKCSGPTITINSKTFGQPFIITAIGNSDMLSSTILAQDTYGYLLKQVYGLELTLLSGKEVIIPPYNRSFDYKYREEWSK